MENIACLSRSAAPTPIGEQFLADAAQGGLSRHSASLPLETSVADNTSTAAAFDVAREPSFEIEEQHSIDLLSNIATATSSSTIEFTASTCPLCSSNPTTIMQHLQSTTCSCGKSMFENLTHCPTCVQQRRSSIKQTYALPLRPSSKSLTPPPSQPSSPRRSTEVTIPAAPSYQSPRRPCAGRALATALSSSSAENDDDDAEDSDAESDGPSLFPPRLYRQPSDYRRRAASSRRTSDDSRGESSRTSSVPTAAKTGSERKDSRSSTSSGVGEAPMAEAFARLSRKAERPMAEVRTRDLSARMFDGPA